MYGVVHAIYRMQSQFCGVRDGIIPNIGPIACDVIMRSRDDIRPVGVPSTVIAYTLLRELYGKDCLFAQYLAVVTSLSDQGDRVKELSQKR